MTARAFHSLRGLRMMLHSRREGGGVDRRRRLLYGSAAAGLSLSLILLLAPRVGARSATSRRVHCVFVDLLSLPTQVFDDMAKEQAKILEPAHIEISWARAHGRAEVREGQILVILTSTPGGSTPREALGAALSRHVVRAAWLYRDPIATLVGADPQHLSGGPDTDFARALGRVSAHELVHVLLPTFPHSRSGLMRPAVKKRDLLGERLALDMTATYALRAWSSSVPIPGFELPPTGPEETRDEGAPW